MYKKTTPSAKILMIISGLAILVVGCNPEPQVQYVVVTSTPTPITPTDTPIPSPLPSNTPTPAPLPTINTLTLTVPPTLYTMEGPTVWAPTRTGRATQDPPGTPPPLITSAFIPTPLPMTGDNLLINGDFEDGSHEQGAPEISVPDGWTAWWFEGAAAHDPRNDVGYGRPEMRVIARVPPYLDPPRIFSGQQAFQAFGMYRVVDCGLYQTVQVEPGRQVELLAYAHAWSSQYDDPHQSDMTTLDDRDNIVFWVGIDPTGGQDWSSANVIWSQPYQRYDAYGPIGPIVVATTGPQVTVFLRGRALWPFKHNDMYWDDARLIYVQ